MFPLSICEGTVLRHLSFEDRVRTISQAGFLVDLGVWRPPELNAMTEQIDVPINAMPGWLRGSMVHPDGVAQFLQDIEDYLPVAEKLGCRKLGLGAGEIDDMGRVVHQIAEHPATKWITAYDCLCRVAELAEKYNVVYNVEPLNTKVDHAGYPFPNVSDVVNLLEEVDSPRIRLLFDIYHTQVQEGNVTQKIRDYADYIGHVHVADAPGRHEPGTGEINYPNVAKTLREVGYDGTVGMEAFPLESDELAMNRFRDAFT